MIDEAKLKAYIQATQPQEKAERFLMLLEKYSFDDINEILTETKI